MSSSAAALAPSSASSGRPQRPPRPALPACIRHLSALVVNRFYFATISGHLVPPSTAHHLFLGVDNCIAYPFIQSYFGPPSLGDIYRYSVMMNALMAATHPATKIVHCTSSADPERRANAALLVGAYAMLYLYIPPRLVYSCLRSHGQPRYLYFGDTASDRRHGRLRILDVLLALHKSVVTANLCQLSDFDVNEYEWLHGGEDGVNMTWVVPGKLLAFAGPVARRQAVAAGVDDAGQQQQPKRISPFYAKYFAANNVQCVVRCNERHYDEQQFVEAGIRHCDLPFEDGCSPSEEVLRRFLGIVEECRHGAVAVHCKAGLGRTGVLIAAWLMKHCGFTADEAVGWLRLCRPGSVIGVQHRFLVRCTAWLRHQGRLWRKEQRLAAGGGFRPQFGIYSINANLQCCRERTDFVQSNKCEMNAVEDQFY